MAIIVGTAGADTITDTFNSNGGALATAGNDEIYGGPDGNDLLAGGGGADTLQSSFGASTLDGGSGNDSVLGIDGTQLLFGGTGNDTLRGGSGADTLRGGDNNDNLAGNQGNDSLDGGSGNDTLNYGSTTASDAATLQGVMVDLLAGTGTDNWGNADTLAGFESVSGSVAADTLIGGNGNDSLFGVEGDDSIRGGAGNDVLSGGFGSDTLEGGAGDDFFRPFDGNDLMIGGAGFDTGGYNGDTGPITAVITAGTDGQSATVTSALGADTLTGIDAIEGTASADTFTVLSLDSDNPIHLRGFGGADTITGNADHSLVILADYRVTGVAQGVVVDLVTGNATDGFGTTDKLININYVRGTDFGDTLLGTDFNDRFRGRAGNDSMDGRGGTGDVLDYGQSASAITANLLTGIVQDGEGGADTVANFEDIYGTTGADSILGSGVAEVFRPFAGADTVNGGGSGSDRLSYIIQNTGNNTPPPAPIGVVVNLVAGTALDPWGNTDIVSGIERVTGTDLADSIIGGAESNRFSGRAGNDRLDGGLGGDYAEYGSATSGANVNLTTGIASDGEGGADTLISIENVIGGAHADTLTGIAQLGRSTSDLRGGAGNDLLIGIVGEYVRAEYAEQTAGLSIDLGAGTAVDSFGDTDTLINIRGLSMFGAFGDTLIGTANNEWFSPSEGNDSVDAGGGFDIISYAAADIGGVTVNLVTQRATDDGGGADTIVGFEAVVLSFGNDTIIGDGNANLIAPGAGADSVNGGLGEDTISYSHAFAPNGIQYNANDAGDRLPVQGVLLDLAAGTATDFAGEADTIVGFEHAIGGTAGDTLRGTTGANKLAGVEGNDWLVGLAGADTIDGDDGADTIDGGDGADRVNGGLGNDLYIVTAGDVIGETGGADTVMSSVSWIMSAAIEALVLTGADTANGNGSNFDNLMVGNVAANRIFGFAGNDTIRGDGGDDFLDGGTGADSIVGGLGDDLLKVDSLADTVSEGSGGGNDTVLSTVDWTLGDHFETLQLSGAAPLIGTGNTLDNRIIGNQGANRLLGGDGADTLDGLVNADTLEGGGGNDTYTINFGADVVVEAPGGGLDTVRSSINHTLAAHVEVLNLIGTTAINGTGNTENNTINGNGIANRLRGQDGADTVNGLGGADTVEGGNGNDRLTSGDGNDVLTGGAGADTLIGGANADIFRYDQSAHGGDSISDFTLGADLFHISRAGFGGVLAVGALAGANFANNAATAAGPQFVYATGTGVLTYDLDGTGAGAAVTIATLTAKPAISAADFVVIA